MSTLSTRFNLLLPDDWTPQQALAVYELLDALRERVWNRYELQLIELLATETGEDDASQPDLFALNDDIPF